MNRVSAPHPAPKVRRPPPKRKGPHPLAILISLGSLPGFFVLGMMTGEVAKSLNSSRVVAYDEDGTPIAAARSDQMKLDISTEAKVAVFNTPAVRIELARGWGVESEAFRDSTALLYFSGPFFEEHKGEHYNANAIGDLYFDDQLQLASNISRGFADRRYYMAKRRSGEIEFGYGGWRPGYEEKYEAFVGGLGYLFDSVGSPDPKYIDPYTGFKQEMHNAIPRERLIIGRDRDHHLLVMKTLPLPQATVNWFARAHGFEEAYYLDQGNKARFIVPGRVEDIPRYNMPYMLRISDMSSPPIPYSPAPLDDYALHRNKKRLRPSPTPLPGGQNGAMPGQQDNQQQGFESPLPESTPNPGGTPDSAPTEDPAVPQYGND